VIKMNAQAQPTITLTSATGRMDVIEAHSGPKSDFADLDRSVRAILAAERNPRIENKIDLVISLDGCESRLTMNVCAEDFAGTLAHYTHCEKVYATMAPRGSFWTAERIEQARAGYAKINSMLGAVAAVVA
jgi:hypothetical protein